jgi:prepilin-type N-terminal cleavage/methylation domain-containing protein
VTRPDNGARSRRRVGVEDDAGFTLVELLVTMSIAVVLLIAILQASEIFRSSSQASGRIADVQETSRQVLRTITSDLRQARSPAPGVTPLLNTDPGSRRDLIAAVYRNDGSPGWVRYCVSADDQSLLVGQVAGLNFPPGGPGPCAINAASSGWQYGPLVDGRLSDPDRLFDFTTDSCTGYATACTRIASKIRTVGIRLALRDSNATSGGRSIVTRGAVALRNAPATP